ncbi:MAG TPA: hypothetical protein VJ576_17440 [Rhodocyclaceae bacterium]|nr:hypothetical protein [Rhodocyclaceae bacterium]
MHPPSSSASQLSDDSESQGGQPSSFEPAPFIYVKIPIRKLAGAPDLARDEAVDRALQDRGVGAVIGWGDSLGYMQPNGSRPAAFHRVDIEVSDLAPALAALREILPALGAPAGTEIHYRLEGRKVQDTYGPSGWLLEQEVAEP